MMRKMKVLDKSALQLIAIMAMTVDHISFMMPTLLWYYTCKFIGKITIVTMCFFVAEGYHKTHDIGRYILRMAIFAAIAELPFYLFERCGSLPGDIIGWIKGMYHCKNVIFTLLIGLCLLTALKSKCNIILKLLAIPAAWYLVRGSDWRYYGLLWILAFGLFHGSPKKQMAAASAVALWRFAEFFMPIAVLLAHAYLPPSGALALFERAAYHINNAEPTNFVLYSSIDQLGCFVPLILLSMYNGKKGNSPRLFFYIYYPAHLMVLFVIKLLAI